MIFCDNQTILFTGDSITDCGRKENPDGLGNGYVSFVRHILSAAMPGLSIRILNTGISGNTITDLERRWQTDVLNMKPDWLSIMIGINDVWRGFKPNPASPPVPIDIYEKVYRKLLEETRPKLTGLVLMTPYLIKMGANDLFRLTMDAYGQIVKTLASDFDAVFVNTQAAFDAYLEHRPAETLAEDSVHPNPTGHMILARAFLAAAGFNMVPA